MEGPLKDKWLELCAGTSPNLDGSRLSSIFRAVDRVAEEQKNFQKLGAWRARFQQSDSVTCVLDATARIIFCNPAWDAFALRNDGERATLGNVLGHSIYEYIPSVLENHYRKLISSALVSRNITGADYECNSPDLFRSYRLLLLPIPDTDLVAMVHALRLERAMSDKKVPAASYRSWGPAVVMCAQCRRTKREDGHWDWVPDFLRNPPRRISHAICQDCMMYVLA
jgi:hypothetical protein